MTRCSIDDVLAMYVRQAVYNMRIRRIMSSTKKLVLSNGSLYPGPLAPEKLATTFQESRILCVLRDYRNPLVRRVFATLPRLLREHDPKHLWKVLPWHDSNLYVPQDQWAMRRELTLGDCFSTHILFNELNWYDSNYKTYGLQEDLVNEVLVLRQAASYYFDLRCLYMTHCC